MNDGANNILVRGVNWLGDAVMTTPALLRLREARPQAKITLLTPAKLADLWTGHPAVDAVIPFGRVSLWEVSRMLRSHQFDTAIVLPNSLRSVLEPLFAGIPRRIGVAGHWRGTLLTDPMPRRRGMQTMRKLTVREIKARIEGKAPPGPAYRESSHQMLHYLHLMIALGASAMPVPPMVMVGKAEKDAFVEKFQLGADRTRPWLGINPGAEYGPAKRWPLDRFIATALEVSAATGARWLLFGGKNDRNLTEEIETALARAKPSVETRNLAGQTTLRELCAGLSLCRVLLTNDTGPMHVATAVGTPVVAPFGSTSPELTGPGLPGDSLRALLKSTAPCSPCFRRECPIDFRCMKGIGVEAVAAAVRAAELQLKSDDRC